ncbi:MAG: hypothetical protein IKR17_02860 [Bacteroidales bacterium]|nr:hypothetical protein [Bacteroidales bacterium]
MTTLEALRGVNSYPIPLRTLQEVAARRGLSLEAEATTELVTTNAAYNLCIADLLIWLSYAPQVSQGGQSYNFTDAQRLQMRNRAMELVAEFGDEGTPKVQYGYKGSRF